jgi:HAD superfamily hydrolase (TIGR01509 family)
MPFAEEFIRLIHEKKIPSAVVTNSQKKDVDQVRKKLSTLNLIPKWFTREDYENPKPSPDGYLKALSGFPMILPSESIGFEDTLKGIQSLKSAKVKPYLICNNNHPQLKNAKDIAHFSSFEPFLNAYKLS